MPVGAPTITICREWHTKVDADKRQREAVASWKGPRSSVLLKLADVSEKGPSVVGVPTTAPSGRKSDED